MTRLSGWGRSPVVDTELASPRSAADLRAAFAHAEGVITRGNGRAYGDAALGTKRTVLVGALDRMSGFDPDSGFLTTEAGTLLSDVIDAFMPRGFFPVVVPGTRFVTVGGAIASDVHGKNHHRDGGFGASVRSIRLMLPDGSIVTTSRDADPELFRATVGGMGLTGTIVEATFRLRPVESGWIRQRTIAAPDLGRAMAALDAGDEATYSVAWIDALSRGADLGRSLVYLGEHARRDEIDASQVETFPRLAPPRLTVPLDLPAITLNRLSVGTFNALYYRLGARGARSDIVVGAGPYFFPLDGIGAWNRIYGKRGFAQHQCVLPVETAKAALEDILDRVAARGRSSFLAVLKKLGSGEGYLSFPRPGYTLALDFAWAPDLDAFLETLDRIVVQAGGRLYLAKDSRQSRETFEAGYPDIPVFRDVRRRVDPEGRIRSHLSQRLGL